MDLPAGGDHRALRRNLNRELRIPFGYVGALRRDLTERKPFFHVLAGSRTLAFGMLGGDLHGPYCQNWLTSQALRNEEAVVPPRPVTAGELAELPMHRGELIARSANCL